MSNSVKARYIPHSVLIIYDALQHVKNNGTQLDKVVKWRRFKFLSETDRKLLLLFLSTDAGATGLNLQTASLLINLDLTWNPAVLEQRIAESTGSDRLIRCR